MKYFSEDFVRFFSELEANNNSQWFQENKKRYEKTVKAPFAEFVTILIAEMAKSNPLIVIEAKDAIHRINRDIRFSKDKSPYKLHASAIISPGGKKDTTNPGIYIELNHLHVRVYGGCYQPDTGQLERIRTAIASDLAGFKKLYSDADFKKTYGAVRGEQAKRLNGLLKDAAEKEPLIFNKSFYYFTELSSDLIASDTLKEEVLRAWKAGSGMENFLRTAMAV